MMLMSELRWGVKPPFKGLKPTPTFKSEPRRDADEILFENLGHLHETGAITIHDEEVLNESLLALARTGVITVNTAKSIQTEKHQISVNSSRFNFLQSFITKIFKMFGS